MITGYILVFSRCSFFMLVRDEASLCLNIQCWLPAPRLGPEGWEKNPKGISGTLRWTLSPPA